MLRGVRHYRVFHIIFPIPLLRKIIPLNLAPVTAQKSRQLVKIHPDLIVAILLRLVKNQLKPYMKVHRLDIVHILLVAVSSMSHVADYIACSDIVTLLETFCVGSVLTKMRIVIIPLFVETADTDAPAAVTVPAERLHIARLHCYDGRADQPHHVVPEMLPLVAKIPAHAKVSLCQVRTKNILLKYKFYLNSSNSTFSAWTYQLVY